MDKHYAIIVGARPNFMKAAPLIKKFQDEGVQFTFIHTGQHFMADMSGIFFRELGLPQPDVFLAGRDMFVNLRRYFEKNSFDGVIVFGDVDSTLAGAVSAFSHGLKVFHIEAGLRSGDERMPEERNRKVVDHLSSLLFVSEPSAIENLLDEGIPEHKIIPVGNLMIESLERNMPAIESSKIVSVLSLKPKSYVVVTLHRRENITNFLRLKKLLKLVDDLNQRVKVVFPIHPSTQAKIYEFKLDHYLHDVLTTTPLSYFDFMSLVKDSQGVVTDSGGIQEETTHLGIPCVTLRISTERPITCQVGSNMVIPEGEEDLEVIIEHLATKFDGKCVPMWDDKVSQRIYENLRTHAND